MRKHLTNAAYGVVDYISYPFGMLLVAPIVLHRLGAAEYGLWMVATAVVSAGGIIASGFCDANIQRVARLRGEATQRPRPYRTQHSWHQPCSWPVLGVLVWLAAPSAALRIAAARQLPLQECLISLRIASALILVRAVESVAVAPSAHTSNTALPLKSVRPRGCLHLHAQPCWRSQGCAPSAFSSPPASFCSSQAAFSFASLANCWRVILCGPRFIRKRRALC